MKKRRKLLISAILGFASILVWYLASSNIELNDFILAKPDVVFYCNENTEKAYAPTVEIKSYDFNYRFLSDGKLFYKGSNFFLCRIGRGEFGIKYNFENRIYELISTTDSNLISVEICSILNDVVYFKLIFENESTDFLSFVMSNPKFRTEYDDFD